MIRSIINYIIRITSAKGEVVKKVNIPAPIQGNVSGDWFVGSDCCTLCGVPETIAPTLFGDFIENGKVTHCYVKKQPETPIEIDQMIEVSNSSELECIYYCGNDFNIMKLINPSTVVKSREINKRPFYLFKKNVFCTYKQILDKK